MDTCYYYDGKTAQSYDCAVNFYDTTVHIKLTQNKSELIIWDKSYINDFNLRDNTLTINYGAFPHQTLECKGNLAHVYFKELSAKNVQKKAENFWLKNIAIATLVLCLLFVLAGLGLFFFALPWVGEKSVALIPENIETTLGENIAESFLQSYEKQDSASYYANMFVSKINTKSTYSIQVTIVESDEINAFALPGGNIFVYSGIIKKMQNYKEFVALLGHEISHVTYQHSLKSICQTAASSIFISFLFGDVSGISAGILQQADQFKQLNYSRELETQADEEGYNLMVANKISPKGMVNLLEILDAESADEPKLMKYFSSHPETAERIKNISSKPLPLYEENNHLEEIFNKMKLHLN